MTLFVSLRDYQSGHVRSSVEGGALSLLDETVKARLELQQIEIDRPSQRSNPAPTLAMWRLAANAFVFKDLVDETVDESYDDQRDQQDGDLHNDLKAVRQAVADALAKHRFETHALVSRALVRMVLAGRSQEQSRQYILATLNDENVRFDLVVWIMNLRENPILGSLVDGVVAVTVTVSPLDNDNLCTNELKVLMARQRDALGLTYDETIRQYQEMANAHHAWAHRR
ncbi:hypothetical protein V7S57_17605 [Caulobacter sp. CCNWLY153]|uniref:hypothetical protein n=1 Tax=unclassified Caulobacter TaxID=2648921 RepID=UPI002FEF2C0D